MRAVWAKSHHAGACNFCSRWATPQGHTDHDVLVLSGDGLIARVCAPCLQENREALSRANRPAGRVP